MRKPIRAYQNCHNIRISRQRHEINCSIFKMFKKLETEKTTKDPKCTFIDEDYMFEMKTYQIDIRHASAHL